jgi:hypothetical protein
MVVVLEFGKFELPGQFGQADFFQLSSLIIEHLFWSGRVQSTRGSG